VVFARACVYACVLCVCMCVRARTHACVGLCLLVCASTVVCHVQALQRPANASAQREDISWKNLF
jgi:hypothetical protein